MSSRKVPENDHPDPGGRETEDSCREFFSHLDSHLTTAVEEREQRRRRAEARWEESLTGMFALLEPTLAGAAAALGVMEERTRTERDRRTERRFSPFALVRTRELDLSRIFGGLLDPAGSHSQGDLFLSLLLEELNASSADAAPLLRDFQPPGGMTSRIHLEYWLGETTLPSGEKRSGIIDIVIALEGNRWIGIENKPWAADQPAQVDRYLTALTTEAEQRGGGEEQVVLLYWSGDGHARDSAARPETRKRCLTMPYRSKLGAPSVEGWLKRCRVECETERVRWFVRDLLDYIQAHFQNSP